MPRCPERWNDIGRATVCGESATEDVGRWLGIGRGANGGLTPGGDGGRIATL